jgi:hypothetical protein
MTTALVALGVLALLALAIYDSRRPPTKCRGSGKPATVWVDPVLARPAVHCPYCGRLWPQPFDTTGTAATIPRHYPER